MENNRRSSTATCGRYPSFAAKTSAGCTVVFFSATVPVCATPDEEIFQGLRSASLPGDISPLRLKTLYALGKIKRSTVEELFALTTYHGQRHD